MSGLIQADLPSASSTRPLPSPRPVRPWLHFPDHQPPRSPQPPSDRMLRSSCSVREGSPACRRPRLVLYAVAPFKRWTSHNEGRGTRPVAERREADAAPGPRRMELACTGYIQIGNGVVRPAPARGWDSPVECPPPLKLPTGGTAPPGRSACGVGH